MVERRQRRERRDSSSRRRRRRREALRRRRAARPPTRRSSRARDASNRCPNAQVLREGLAERAFSGDATWNGVWKELRNTVRPVDFSPRPVYDEGCRYRWAEDIVGHVVAATKALVLDWDVPMTGCDGRQLLKFCAVALSVRSARDCHGAAAEMIYGFLKERAGDAVALRDARDDARRAGADRALARIVAAELDETGAPK